MKIIFIHGRSQGGKDPNTLKQIWDDALNKGFANAGLSRPKGLETEMPFYGDLLDSLLDQLQTPTVAEVQTKGAAPDNIEMEFRGELIKEIAVGIGLTDKDIAEEFGPNIREKGPMNWEWIHSILKRLDKSNKLGDLVVDKFTRDVYIYLTRNAVRKRIDEVLSPYITGDNTVVVGHSLGSIVGYNVLRTTTNKVKKYVTIGSPLGINAIKRRLETPLTMPPTTLSWYNAMDEGDVVALFPLDETNFPITPSITNKTDVSNCTDNHHGIVGYLPDPEIARAIWDGLQ